MDKYINADKIQEVIDWYEHKEIVSDTDLQSAFIDIMNLPSADVVEVVRCKNCQYCKHLKEIDKYYCERNFSRFETSPDGFCDKGAEI